MALLSTQDQQHIRHLFEEMANPVRIVLFTATTDCPYCDTTREIVEEVASLSSKLSVEQHDLEAEPAVASAYAVDRAPAIALVQVGQDGVESKDFGLRFYGIPSGYEFGTLLEDILMVSTGNPQLMPATKAWLSTLKKPVRLQVFVTPTCPYCPRMVSLAHKLAVASEHIRAEGVEASEFPVLAAKYGVQGVPRTVISVDGAADEHLVGAVPEADLLAALRKATGSKLIIARA